MATVAINFIKVNVVFVFEEYLNIANYNKNQIRMKNDPEYEKLLQKSHIMRKHHQSHRNISIPQIQKQPNIVHKVISTGILSTLIHIVAFPFDTFKVRKMARSKVNDVSRFEQNKVVTLTPYLGFFKGYLSILIGNLCFLTLGQQNFYLGVMAEGVIKTFVDMSKISTQMGNTEVKYDIIKKSLPVATVFSVLRDLTSRSSYMLIVTLLLQKNKEWIKQDSNRKYHIFFAGAILATIISHPFDVAFTRLASQRSPQYTGLFQTITAIIKQDGAGKLYSGLDFRLLYNLVGAIIMGNCYDSLLHLTIEAY